MMISHGKWSLCSVIASVHACYCRFSWQAGHIQNIHYYYYYFIICKVQHETHQNRITAVSIVTFPALTIACRVRRQSWISLLINRGNLSKMKQINYSGWWLLLLKCTHHFYVKNRELNYTKAIPRVQDWQNQTLGQIKWQTGNTAATCKAANTALRTHRTDWLANCWQSVILRLAGEASNQNLLFHMHLSLSLFACQRLHLVIFRLCY